MGVSYLICAAGRGTRMKAISERIPKPLLKIEGRTLLEHAIDSLPLENGDQVVVIGRRGDGLDRLADPLRSRHPGCSWEWVDLDRETRGQLETAFFALDRVPSGNSIAIFNADSSFQGDVLSAAMADSGWEGIIPCSVEAGDAWSFCRVGEDGRTVIEVAEKRRISPWCSVGFYFFRDAVLFRALAAEELAGPTTGELYVIPLYDRYLREGRKILMLPVPGFKAMGTVEQIGIFWGLTAAAMKAEQGP